MLVPETPISHDCSVFEDLPWDEVLMDKIRTIFEKGWVYDLTRDLFRCSAGLIFNLSPSYLAIEEIRALDLMEIAPYSTKLFEEKETIYKEWGFCFSSNQEETKVIMELIETGQKASVFTGPDRYEKRPVTDFQENSSSYFSRIQLFILGAMMVLPEDKFERATHQGLVVVEERCGLPLQVRALALPGRTFKELDSKPPINQANADDLYIVNKDGRFRLPTRIIQPVGLFMGDINIVTHSYGR